jgi:eukaryotic-like serine/threonine-protein kinase
VTAGPQWPYTDGVVVRNLGSSVLPGDLIAGKYRVERVLASGGMGMVLTAYHESLDQRVAIKLMQPALAANPNAIERFKREARAAARIKTEHAIRVFDVDRLPDGAPYIVMEFLEGQSLDQILAAHGRLPIHDAADFAIQALAAIAEAHSVGIVHRDLKPPNLFLNDLPDGRRIIKVLDFGISKLTETTSLGGLGVEHDITSSQAMLGTPAYMAPEQVVSARDVDGRSDLWSIGVILYEMLAGRALFASDTAGRTFANVINMPIPDLREHRPEVPDALAAIVLRCLERDSSERFASANELMDALAPFGTDAVAALRSDTGRFLIAEPTGAAAPRAPATDLTFGKPGPAPRRSTLPIVVPTVLTVVLGCAVLWLLFGQARFNDPAPAAPAATAPTEATNATTTPAASQSSEAPEPTATATASATVSASANAPPSKPPPALPRPAQPRFDNLGLDDRN